MSQKRHEWFRVEATSVRDNHSTFRRLQVVRLVSFDDVIRYRYINFCRLYGFSTWKSRADAPRQVASKSKIRCHRSLHAATSTMTQLSWLQSYSFMVGVILCWSPNGRTGFAAAAGKGWMNGRISALSSTRGRTALGLPSFVTRRNRYYYYSSYHQRRANPTTTISTPGLVDQLRGGGDQGYGQDSYYQTEDASPFDESQPPPQDDPYYATSPQRRRRRYNNIEDETYYGEQPDDRYSYYENNESYYDDRGRPPPVSVAYYLI